MRFVPALFLNVVVAAGTVFVYDQLRGAPESPVRIADDASAEIEARLEALESAKPVALRTDGAAASMLRRIEELEAELAAVRARKAPPSGETVGTRGVPPSGETVAGAGPEGPSAEEIARFRELQKAVQERAWREKQAKRVAGALVKAGVRLSAADQARVVTAQAEFSERFNEIWSEAKSSAAEDGGEIDWTTVIRETNATIQSEFAGRMGAFLGAADAEAVAAALYPSRSK